MSKPIYHETPANVIEMFGFSPDIQVDDHPPTGEVKIFLGEGTGALRLGRCSEVIGVRVDGVFLPEFDQHEVIDEENPGKTKILNLRVWALFGDETGETILARGITSNHGQWQKGSTIVVNGHWQSDFLPISSEPLAGVEGFVPVETEEEPVAVDPLAQTVELAAVLKVNGKGNKPAEAAPEVQPGV